MRKSSRFASIIVASLAMLFCNSCNADFNTKEKIVIVTNPKYDLTKANVKTNEGLTENERMDYLIKSLNNLTTKKDYVIFNGGLNFHAGDTSEVKTLVSKFNKEVKAKKVYLCGVDGLTKKQWEGLGLKWNHLIQTNKSQILCLSANDIHEKNYDLDQILSMYKDNKKKKIFVTPWVYARKGGPSVESHFYEYSKDEKFMCLFSGFNPNHHINSGENYMTYRNRLMPVISGGNFSFPFQKPSEYKKLNQEEFVDYAWSFDVLEFYTNSCEYYMYQPERQYKNIDFQSKGKIHSLKLYEVNNFSIILGIGLASGVVYLFIAVYPLKFRREDDDE